MHPENCPVRAALSVIGGKWKPVIIYYLREGTKRFGELRKCVPDATQKMLTQQLRELERDGVIVRKVYHEVPPKVEYSLTAHGQTLRSVMRELCKWGEKHTAPAMTAHKQRTRAQASKREHALSASGVL